MIKQVFLLFFLMLFIKSIAQEKPSDYLPKDFFQQRREELRKLLPPNSVAVFFTNPIRNRSNDVDYVYHQDPDFYYFSGYREPNAVLLIFSEFQKFETIEKTNEIIFVQPNNPEKELWNGKRLGVDGAKSELGILTVLSNSEFAGFNINFQAFDKILHPHFHHDVRDDKHDDSDLFDLINVFEKKIHLKNTSNKKSESQKIVNNISENLYHQITASLREIKTVEEIELIRKAVKISAIAQIEVMKAIHPEMSETEIQGIHEFVFKKYGAEYEGYPSIVGAGKNGCILHYTENIKPMVNNELILMDLGAEYRGYTADVTRTIPANGKFTDEQKAIYDIVFRAQEATIKALKPGIGFYSAHKEAEKIIIEGLKELGIIKNNHEYKRYLPHGISHHIGLDVHDKNNFGPLKENMVITIEPGIYIPEGSPCDQKWWGIGVRIEDDILITKNGFENLSGLAPRSINEIEKTMAQPSALDQLILPSLD